VVAINAQAREPRVWRVHKAIGLVMGSQLEFVYIYPFSYLSSVCVRRLSLYLYVSALWYMRSALCVANAPFQRWRGADISIMRAFVVNVG